MAIEFRDYGESEIKKKIHVMVSFHGKDVSITDGAKTVFIPPDIWNEIVQDFRNLRS